VRPEVAPRFHGAPRLNMDPETHDTLCIACNLCAIACPEDCIDVIPMDVEIVVAGQAAQKESARRVYLRHFALHVLRVVPGSVSRLHVWN
jgi:formate hydrogenlyase subunit 6/NADH:ubiquinone oxidoreductase subunit I